jgi:hypothetical protein
LQQLATISKILDKRVAIQQTKNTKKSRKNMGHAVVSLKSFDLLEIDIFV